MHIYKRNLYLTVNPEDLKSGITYDNTTYNLFNEHDTHGDYGNLYVYKKSVLNGDVYMNSNVCVYNTTTLKKDVFMENNLNINGNLNLDLNLNVKSNVNILNDLVVENKSYLKKDTNIEGDLTVVKYINIG